MKKKAVGCVMMAVPFVVICGALIWGVVSSEQAHKNLFMMAIVLTLIALFSAGYYFFEE
jgi:sugar phosphate permease